MFFKKRYKRRSEIERSRKIVLPDTVKYIEKENIEFRTEAYKLWLEIFKRETKIYERPGNAYGEDCTFYLVSPRGNTIPLSWIEINVLEEYMSEFVERQEEIKKDDKDRL